MDFLVPKGFGGFLVWVAFVVALILGHRYLHLGNILGGLVALGLLVSAVIAFGAILAKWAKWPEK